MFAPITNFFSSQGRIMHLFWEFCWFYIKKKTTKWFKGFEQVKDILVKFLLMKRGRYNRPFMHIATLGVLVLGILIGPFLADTFPIFATSASVNRLPSPAPQEQSLTTDANVFQTDISQKPRSEVLQYIVERGDTLSTIADKFGISVNTIKWENDLSDDSVTVGDTIRVLPVTGISYKVQKGDTVYTIAKQYGTNPQKIVDFPFNDFANPETFSLVAGEILMVPDGVKPSQQQSDVSIDTYAAKIDTSVLASGGYNWPINGLITQTPSWYHMAYDLAAPIGSPIVATKNGIVKEVFVGGWNYGYGNYVVIDHGDGYSSLYAHMLGVNVSVGQQVSGGSTVVGWIGLTGRTTGAHVHFEIRKNNVTINPASFLH